MENAVIERINKIIKWYIFWELVENNAIYQLNWAINQAIFLRFWEEKCQYQKNSNKIMLIR